MQPKKQTDRLLRKNDIIGGSKPLIPIKTTALYAAIARGDMPPPVKIGRTSVWRESEIMAVVAGTYRREAAADE